MSWRDLSDDGGDTARVMINNLFRIWMMKENVGALCLPLARLVKIDVALKCDEARLRTLAESCERLRNRCE